MREITLLVGNKIRSVRELQGVSQEFLSTKLGISQAMLSKIENNESKISIEKLQLVSDILGVDINTIVNFDKSVIFNSCSQSGNNNNYTINSIEILENLYREIIEEKNERIRILEKLSKS